MARSLLIGWDTIMIIIRIIPNGYVYQSQTLLLIKQRLRKRFVTLIPGPSVIKHFTNGRNKLERLSLTGLSSLVYCLWVRLLEPK
jgi:hypothetical protein